METAPIRVSLDRLHLEVFDVNSGEKVISRPVKGTEVIQLLPVGSNFVVRESYYKFPAGASNVYCVDSELRTVWEAELPDPTDVYANHLTHMQGVLQCASWNCVLCYINIYTGKILEQRFTK